MARELTAADRVEIHELVARYNVAVDARDPEALVATFTVDGVFDGVIGIYRGHEELRSFIEELREAAGNQQYARTQHWTDNLIIDGTGDEATLYCHHALLRPLPGGGGEVLLMAEYHDVVRRVDGRWLFSLRKVRRTDQDELTAESPLVGSNARRMHVEDIEQIKVAKALYARHCDSGYDPEGVAGVFVEEGIWESDDLGVHEGRDAIRSFMSGVGKSFVWARHLLLNPIIEVDDAGESAHAEWLLWCPAVVAKEDGTESSVLMVCNYDDRLVKRDGRWWFEHMHVSSLRSTVLPDAWRDGLAG